MEIDEQGKKVTLWVRRKKTGLKLICSRCGQHVSAARIHEVCEREVRDLPCFEYTTTVAVETYRVKCTTSKTLAGRLFFGAGGLGRGAGGRFRGSKPRTLS